MSDLQQSSAVKLQSSAIVLASMITTMGAVTAACIQSGFLGKQAPTSTFAAHSTAMKPTTSVVADMEPPAERTVAMAQPAANPQLQFRTPPAYQTSTARPASSTFPTSNAMPSGSAYSYPSNSALPPGTGSAVPPGNTSTLSGAPVTPNNFPASSAIASNTPTRSMTSPWASLSNPTTTDQPKAPPKSSSKWVDFGAVTRFFSGH